MLIYQAQSARNTQLFSDFVAAKKWVEQNADGHEPYWKQNSPDSWVLNAGGTGMQVGAMWAAVLETDGEKDPLRLLAFAILSGDAQACDAARDVLKC